MRKKTIENYVELIYTLQRQKKKERVHTTDIASILQITPASVTEIFRKLSNQGYLNYEKYSGVTLTTTGKTLAQRTKRKHDALKRFLLLLGLDEGIAEHDACEMEHFLHPTTLDKIVKLRKSQRKKSV